MLLLNPRSGQYVWLTFSGMRTGAQFAFDMPGAGLRLDSFVLEVLTQVRSTSGGKGATSNELS